jgi:glycosyltransferase involved in cell wall biosynthesis
MQVLLVTTSYPLSEASASGIFVARLGKYLQQMHGVRVVVPADWQGGNGRSATNDPEVLPYRYAPQNWQRLAHSPGGIPVALNQNRGMYFLVPPFLGSMFISCLRHGKKADVIHANWAICGLIAGAAGKLLGVPVVVSLRGEDMTRGTKKLVDRWILKGCVTLCTRVIGVSAAIVDQLRDVFPEHAEKFRLIENGVDERFLALERQHPSGNALHLVAIGSLIQRKGVDVAITAVAAVPGVHLTIIGDGPERKALQDLINELDVSDRVELRGWVEPDAVPAQLAKHDVLVLPSYSEGRPNVVLEAMASAMPVLASDIEGVDELVEHNLNGFLFPPGDSDRLAALVQCLNEDMELFRTMGENGRQRILDMGLVWEQTAERYGQAYIEATGDAG